MKRNRVIISKSRAGCRTCKQRRVKCDEAKPYCIRCLSGNRICEGYGIVIDVPKSASYESPSFELSLLCEECEEQSGSRPDLKGALGVRKRHKNSKTGCFTCKARKIKCDETKPGCKRCWGFGVKCDGYPNPSPLFGSAGRNIQPMQPHKIQTIAKRISRSPCSIEEQEGRYFRYYCEDIAAQISGPFNTSTWRRVIPQAGELEPFIRHAVIAIGALSKSRAYEYHQPVDMDSHHEYALIQYGKALTGMRRAIQNQEQDSRKALLACLLVFCFEGLLGRQASASAHASSAINLLYRWGSNQGNPIVGRKDHPSHHFLDEDGLYSAFSGLDLQALLFVDHRPLALHKSLKGDLNEVVKLMPATFESLTHCTTFCHLITRRNLHFIATTRAALREFESSMENVSMVVQEAIYMRPGNTPWNFLAYRV